MLTEPDEGLVRKFDRQQDDAIKKWKRQGGGNFATFFDLRTVDFGIDRDRALAAVEEWAKARAKADGVLIAVCFNHRWREPFVTAGIWN